MINEHFTTTYLCIQYSFFTAGEMPNCLMRSVTVSLFLDDKLLNQV